MGTGYNKKPWETGGEGSEAQEAFEDHSHGMLLDGITISMKGYKEGLYQFPGRRRGWKSLCYFLL